MVWTAIVFAATPFAARAQLLGQYLPGGIPGYQNWFSDAVLERPHTEYDPLGVRVGSFVIRPDLSESFGYNSNVLNSAQAVGSPFIDTQGRVSAASDWSRDRLNAEFSADNRQYVRQPNASYTNWSAALGGVLDIGNDHATVAFTHLTETSAAAQIGTLSTGLPVTVSLDSAHLGYEATLGRVTLEPSVEAAAYRFSNGPSSAAGEATNNRNTAAASLAAGYRLFPGASLVLVGSATDAAYTTTTPGMPTPNYQDKSLVGGIDYRSGSLFRYRVTLGYETRDYISRQLSGTSAPLAELDVIWTPTRLTTVTGQASRSLQNAIATAGSESYTYSDMRVVIDHEYLRNVLLQGFGEYQTADYQLRGETQHVVSAGASVNWLLNRRLAVIGRVTYSQSTDNVFSTLNQSSSLAELTLDLHL